MPVCGVTYAAYFPEGASVTMLDERRLEVFWGRM